MQHVADGVQELVERVNGLSVWTRDGQRAPHKPLLLLLALAKAAAGEDRLLAFTEIEAPLRKLLEAFGPSRRAHHPEYPFWYLRTDGLWEVEEPTPLRRRKKGGDASGNPPATELRRQNTKGGLPSDLYEAVRADPDFASRLANSILIRHFPVSFHEEILAQAGLKAWEKREMPLGDAEFEATVLAAYRHSCALCGFRAQLGAKSFGVEATPIRWLQAGGKLKVDNYLAFCLIHRRAFERGACAIDAKNRLILSAALVCYDSSRPWFSRFQGRSLHRPVKQTLVPRVENLAWHREEVFRWPASTLK
jgi:putative restriction endonuclease